MEKRFQKSVGVLDPNQRMAAFLFEVNEVRGNGNTKTNLDMQVVSRIIWDQVKIDAIAGVIEKQSAEAALALRKYERIPDLFTF